MITAVLLAAGYATRLYPLTTDRPKTLLRLGRGVILDEVVRAVREVPDVRRILLVSNGRFAAQFEAWRRSARQTDVEIINDGTMTAETRLGAIRDLALAHRDVEAQDDLLVVGTDNLFRWSMSCFAAQAQRMLPHASVALWHAPSRDVATQCGVVVRDAEHRITQFAEKSPQPPSAEVAVCVYYLPAAIRAMIGAFLKEGNADAPGFFIQWLARRSPVYGVEMPGEWHDIGTIKAYEAIVKTWTTTSTRKRGAGS
ncbi:MAG: NTP transferase domain-containing protein [Candidatus Omnitrophica bacterium]|nr:NTP transferase domain-containing protein [Candidatus Omnitrophota bacterium]